MKKVVVTGGAGFIGSHLAEELANRGHHVIVLDDLSTGKLENIETFVNRDNVEFVQGSITELPVLQRLVQGAEYVFHQAAIPSVPRSIEDPVATHQVNATGTLNVLLAARDNAVRKVVYASSCAVYGDSPDLPSREDTPPRPLSPYAVTKLAGEYYCRVFQEVYGLSTVSLRYFNVFGPRQDPTSDYAAVIPRFIARVSAGQPPIIFGDGEQTRDFVFVKDVVEANILAAESGASGLYNVGTGQAVSINQLASLIVNISKKDLKPIHQEPRPGDIRHSLADIAESRNCGYDPECELEEGLRRTMVSHQGQA